MNNTPLVSFVVPCYNYGRYLPDCLGSIFGQEGYDDFEVITIDDCSTDNTREVLAGYSDRRLRVIHHEVNRGHVWTVNEGFALARGRFVARIDPDDRYRPHFLKMLLPKFEGSPHIGMVFGAAAIIDGQGAVTTPCCRNVFGGRDFCGNQLLPLLEQNYICAPTAIARREAWQVGFPIWEGLAFNDWYLNVMIARAYDLSYVHEVVADYRVHACNHHTLIVRSKSEEPSIFRVLDHVFSTAERDPLLEGRKQAAKDHIYATWYLDQAEKYFGTGYFKDARRCYREVWRRQPGRMLRLGLFRRWVMTYLGPRRYERWKSFARRLIHGRPSDGRPTPSSHSTNTRTAQGTETGSPGSLNGPACTAADSAENITERTRPFNGGAEAIDRRHTSRLAYLLARYYLAPDHPAKLRIWRYLYRLCRRPPVVVNYAGGALLRLDYLDYVQAHILRTGSYEPEVWDVLSAFATQGEVLWDVGAHVGAFSIRAALDPRVQVVHCFEPHPQTGAALRRNLGLNRLPVRHHAVALGDRVGQERLSSGSFGNVGTASLCRSQGEGRYDVPCTTADQLVSDGLELPTLIKLDVEGWELAVLRGASGILSDHRLKAVVFEAACDAGGRLCERELAHLLGRFGYRVHRIVRPEGGLEPRENFVAARDLPRLLEGRLGR
jgi:FkbM family methyltransferase